MLAWVNNSVPQPTYKPLCLHKYILELDSLHVICVFFYAANITGTYQPARCKAAAISLMEEKEQPWDLSAIWVQGTHG